MSTPSIGSELRRYSALAWAIVATLFISVSLFIHFLMVDHTRAVDNFYSDARHGATISELRMVVLLEHLETFGHEYLLVGASNKQLMRLMSSLNIRKLITSLCTKAGASADVLYSAATYAKAANASCIEDFSSLGEAQSHDDGHSLVTDFAISRSISNEQSSLKLRMRDSDGRELRAVVSSAGLLGKIVVENAEITKGSESVCIAVRLDGIYKDIACHVDDETALQPVNNPMTLIEDIETAGLHWRLVVTPKLAVLSGDISRLPFVMFAISLVIGMIVCVFAYKTADKNILLEARADELRLRLEQLVQLEEQNGLLDQFAAMAAHDLQAPLRFIVSNAHLLIFELEELDLPELTKLATTQVEQGERMRSLVVDLLEFCRAGQSSLTIAPVNVRTMVGDEIRLLKMHDEFTGTRFDVGSLPKTLVCDEDKLKHIIRNLLGNAVKFSQTSELPTVSINAKRDTFHAPWTFYIRDNGPGVPIEHHQRIFRPFARLNSETKGTGMGLAIVKIMLDRQGGTIWIDSDDTSGSTFCFTMPGATPEGSSE